MNLSDERKHRLTGIILVLLTGILIGLGAGIGFFEFFCSCGAAVY